jgi:hypothetical protein
MSQVSSAMPSPIDDAPLLFVSHAAADKELALFLKNVIEKTFDGIDVFVSSDPEDLPIGDPWVERILEALGRARLIVVLGTDRALSRKWVWFEAGAGWDRRRKIVTSCIGNTRKSSLPPPFGLHTAQNLDEEGDCREFFNLVRSEFGLEHRLVDYADLCTSLIRLDIRADERQRLAAIENVEKPFHDAQQRSLDERVGKLDLHGRDLVRYLLLNGESSGRHIYASALFPDSSMGNLLQQLESLGLVLVRIERIGSMESNRFWKVNPEFSDRLKALFFPRDAVEGPLKFRPW